MTPPIINLKGVVADEIVVLNYVFFSDTLSTILGNT